MAINLNTPVSEQTGVPVVPLSVNGINLQKPPKTPDLSALTQLLEKHKLIKKTGQNTSLDEAALDKLDQKTVRDLQQQLTQAGLYGLKIDGKAGAGTKFALQLAASPNAAVSHLDQALQDNKLLNDPEKMAKAQAALNRLGYKVGALDGAIGPKTGTALNVFVEHNDQVQENMSPQVGQALNRFDPVPDLLGNYTKPMGGPVSEPKGTANTNEDLRIRNPGNKVLLRADMLEFLQHRPERRQYLTLAQEAAREHGLDENMFANQIFQESGFNPKATGPRTKFGRALGIAQFLPSTASAYGLSAADLRDPTKTREILMASAKYMSDLRDKHGSQELAMIAYNGGDKAIEYVKGRLKTENLTVDQWMGYMGAQRAKYGAGKPGSWRNETYNYVAINVSDYWPERTLKRALEKPENALPAQPQKPGYQPVILTQASDSDIRVDGISTNIPSLGGSGLKGAFGFATSDANSSPVLSADVQAAAPRSFLHGQFSMASTRVLDAPKPNDIVLPQKKDPVLTNTGPSNIFG